MGLFDQMMGGFLSNMLNKAGPDGAGSLIETVLNGPMGQMLPGLLNSAFAKTPFGSIDGALEQLQQAGLSDAVASWISTGPNVPVSAEQITSALGEGQLAQIAGALGLSAEQLPEILAQHLPTIIDRLSPEGVLELPGR
ncbi:YidB family protein [Xanthobacter autotrophicus]|uniref:YidB family protein n=1 Tax=Xanthobacter TaxID=279 RepID=UPI0024AC372E|nr:YidB family protein [Xanthobacter autotrophicus]MDI4665994.1 YidB family protein [Xanthobacter autotrophicus]